MNKNKRKVQTQKVTLVASALLGAVALFPPCQTASGITMPREFLFFINGIVEINAGRLLAEALLIAAVAGFAMVYVWGEDA